MSRYALTVRVIGAMEVTSSSKRTKYLKGAPDLYCQVAVLPPGSTEEGKQRTKVAATAQGNDPKWNEVLEFQLASSVLLPDVQLEFSIFDQNRGRDSAVSKATFAVSRYAGKGLQSGEEWMSLSSAKKEAAGRLHVHVAWTRIADHPQQNGTASSGVERTKALVEQAHRREQKNRRNNALFSQFSGLEPRPLVGTTVDEPCTVIAPDQTAVDARVVVDEQLRLQFFKGRKPTQGQTPWKSFPLQHCSFADVCRQELLDSYDSASLYSGDEAKGDASDGSGTPSTDDEESCWACPSQEVIEKVTPGLVQFQSLWRGYRERKRFKRSPGHEKRRGHLVQELLSTERKYVESLEVLKDVLLAPMTESEGLRALTSSLHEYAGQLLRHHAALLPRLEELAAGWSEEKEGLGELFTSIAGFSGTYTSYVKHYSEVLALISSARRQPDNAALIAQLERDPRCNRAQLNSFLIMPVQRVPRYRMFLTDLIKYAPANHRDLQAMNGSAAHIAKLATTMDEHCMSIENVKRVLAIQEKFVGLPTFAEPSRHYVREANLALWPTKQLHKVFLMNDVLIVGTLLDKEAKEGPSYKLRYFIELKDVVLFPMGHDSFQLADSRTGQVAVMLTCPSAAVQQAWVADLHRLLSAPPMRQENRKLQFEHQLRLQEAESNTISFSYCGSTWKVALENRIRKDKILNSLLACNAYLLNAVVAELCSHVGSRGNDHSRGRKGTDTERLDVSAYKELIKLTSDDDSCHSAVTNTLSALLEVVQKEQAMAAMAENYKEHIRSLEATKAVQHQLLLQQNFIQAESNFAQPSVWKKVARRQAPPQFASQKSTLLSGFLHGTSNLSKDLQKRGRPRRASLADVSRSSSPHPVTSSSQTIESSRSRSRKDLKMAGLEGEVAELRASLESVLASQTQANSTIASLLVTIEKQEAISQRVLRHLDDASSRADQKLLEVNEEQAARILVLERDLLVKDKEIELLHLRLSSLEQSKRAAEQEQAELLQGSIRQQEQSSAAITALTEQVSALASVVVAGGNLERQPASAAGTVEADTSAPASESGTSVKISDLAPKKQTNRRSMSLATVTKGIRKKVSKSGDDEQPETPGKKGRSRERKALGELTQHCSDAAVAYDPEATEDSNSVRETHSRKSKKSKRKSRSEKSEKKVRKKKEKKKEASETATVEE